MIVYNNVTPQNEHQQSHLMSIGPTLNDSHLTPVKINVNVGYSHGYQNRR